MSVLWTIMPTELVLDGLDKLTGYEEIDLDGLRVQVERLSPLEGRVVRLLSTLPSAYLQPQYQPGAIISYRPVSGA